MPRLLSLLLILNLLLAAEVPSAQARKPHQVAPAEKQAQQPRFSFLAPSLPNPTLARLTTPLTGRVVEQQFYPSTFAPRTPAPVKPKYTQIFLTPAQLAALGLTPALPQAEAVKHQETERKAKRIAAKKARVDYKTRSWVGAIETDQAGPLAENIAQFLAEHFDPAETTLLLAIPPSKQRMNPFTPAFKASLRNLGFALADSRAQAPNARLLRYQVSELNEGVWVQLQVNQQQVNRFYPFNAANQLMATSPFSVRPMTGRLE